MSEIRFQKLPNFFRRNDVLSNANVFVKWTTNTLTCQCYVIIPSLIREK